MNKRTFKKQFSLLSNSEKFTLVLLNGDLTEMILKNSEFKERCLSQTEAGREELEKKMTKAHKTFFSKEDMVHWLDKIKQDAKVETNKIAIHFTGTTGMTESKIDFEKVGFLAGIYDAADSYLNEITAATPSHENQAHNQVYDRLEELDEFYLKNDHFLPGYYQVQRDKKIMKHLFELNSLDDYWKDYLALKDKHHVTEDFGDKKHLLDQYHTEFAWQLIKLRPRDDSKSMLDHHYHKHRGAHDDFLDHIEFRILPIVENYSGTDLIIYRQMIQEWIREKKDLLSREDERFLLDSIVNACAAFLNSLAVHRPLQDENKYNMVIRDLLQQGIRSKGWFVNDQSLGGFTDSESKAYRAGIASRDLVVVNEKQRIFASVEFFRLSYVPRSTATHSVVSLHLSKIFRNEITGVSPLFVIVYCESASFAKTWKQYLEYLQAFDFGNYPLLEIKNGDNIFTSANLKLVISVHNREEVSLNLHHLFINMRP